LAIGKHVSIHQIDAFLFDSPRTTPYNHVLPPNATPPSKETVVRDLRVLVVDPCPNNVNSLCLVLTLWGCATSSACDGHTALEVYRGFRPDVVLIEVALPGLDGWELGRRLLQQGRARPVLVALTGYGREQDRARSCEAHLTRPADLGELQRLLGVFVPMAFRQVQADPIPQQAHPVLAGNGPVMS
jgi:CheY-like chemotaxis protein